MLLEPNDPEVCGPAPEQRYGIRYGLQSMCEVGGMANAIIVELL